MSIRALRIIAVVRLLGIWRRRRDVCSTKLVGKRLVRALKPEVSWVGVAGLVRHIS